MRDEAVRALVFRPGRALIGSNKGIGDLVARKPLQQITDVPWMFHIPETTYHTHRARPTAGGHQSRAPKFEGEAMTFVALVENIGKSC